MLPELSAGCLQRLRKGEYAVQAHLDLHGLTSEGAHQRVDQFIQHSRVDAQFFPRLQTTLAEIHRQGITHNDLSKPENILVKPDGAPILIDFQIALDSHSRIPVWSWLKRRIVLSRESFKKES